MLSLGGERLNPKVLDHCLHHDLGVLPLLRCFFCSFTHFTIPRSPPNLISSSLYYSGPVHKMSSQSVHNFLSYVVHRQTNRQTDRQTNQRYQKHNLLAKEVINTRHYRLIDTKSANECKKTSHGKTTMNSGCPKLKGNTATMNLSGISVSN